MVKRLKNRFYHAMNIIANKDQTLKLNKPVKMTKAYEVLSEYRNKKSQRNPLDDFKLEKFKTIKSKVRESLEKQALIHFNTRNASFSNEYHQ